MVIQMVVCRLVMVQIDGDITGDGGSADGNDRDNTAGGDGNSESTDDGQFTPITVEEVSKLFLSVRLAKRVALTIYVLES